LEDVPISYDQSLLKEIVAKHYRMEILVLVPIMLMHF
jgi:hypothetical protein